MTIGHTILMLIALGLTAGCARTVVADQLLPESPRVTIADEAEWRSLATAEDAARLDTLAVTWSGALAGIRSGRYARLRETEGALLDPASAQAFPAPPPGHYRCRVVRIPQNGRLTSYKPWSCHVGNDGKLLSFTKEGGSDRPAGWLWNDGDKRLVFLGAMVDGDAAPAYGVSNGRNVVGTVERVADFRWRMVLPSPVEESRLDVIELIPMVPAAQAVAPA